MATSTVLIPAGNEKRERRWREGKRGGEEREGRRAGDGDRERCGLSSVVQRRWWRATTEVERGSLRCNVTRINHLCMKTTPVGAVQVPCLPTITTEPPDSTLPSSGTPTRSLPFAPLSWLGSSGNRAFLLRPLLCLRLISSPHSLSRGGAPELSTMRGLHSAVHPPPFDCVCWIDRFFSVSLDVH
jgi:hypothetical protein